MESEYNISRYEVIMRRDKDYDTIHMHDIGEILLDQSEFVDVVARLCEEGYLPKGSEHCYEESVECDGTAFCILEKETRRPVYELT